MFYKKFKSKYSNIQKKEILEPVFKELNLYVVSNKKYSSFYFEYNGKQYRASLHKQPESFNNFKSFDIEIISNSYDNLAKKIRSLKI